MTDNRNKASLMKRVAQKLITRGGPVGEAVASASGVATIANYEKNGRIPWSPGYSKAKNVLLKNTIEDPALMQKFAKDERLPANFGARIDERVVECPWALTHIRLGSGLILDAGSVLNLPMLLDSPYLANREMVISSLEMDYIRLDSRLSYVHGDFRNSIMKNESFDTIVCISTLEHVGMWPIPKPPFDVNLKKPQPEKDLFAYRGVMEIFRNLLKPGGQLLLTVPYGFGEDQDWLKIYGADDIADVKRAFGGECRVETYYRHHPDGWQTATPEECADLHYFNIVRTPEFDADYAAAARAVACLELVRPI